MKIIGGSFGLSGKARLSGDYLEIFGDRKAEYKPKDVSSVNVRQESDRKFGLIGALIGALLFGYIGSLFIGLLGWLIGIVFAIAGSFYSKKKYFADLEFIDGSSLLLQPNDHEAKKLVKFPDR